MIKKKKTTIFTEDTEPLEVKLEEAFRGPMIAKKDFVIRHNDYFKEIKAGDDLSDVPEMYLQNLKTENVL